MIYVSLFSVFVVRAYPGRACEVKKSREEEESGSVGASFRKRLLRFGPFRSDPCFFLLSRNKFSRSGGTKSGICSGFLGAFLS